MARAPTFINQQSLLEADEADLAEELLFAIANNKSTDCRRRHQLEQRLVPLSEALAWFEPDPAKCKELPERLSWPLTHNWLTLYGTPKGRSKSGPIPTTYFELPFVFDVGRNEVQPRKPIAGRRVYCDVAVRQKRLEHAKQNDLYEQVKHFKLTPAEGELEAARCGLKPLNQQPDPTTLDPLKDARWSRWTPAMALAWIVWRKAEKVRLQCEEWRSQLKTWKRLRTPGDKNATLHLVEWTPRHARKHGACSEIQWAVQGEVRAGQIPCMPIEQAKDDLWRALEAGLVKAVGILDGKPGLIDPVAFAYLEICEPLQRDELEYLSGSGTAVAEPLFDRDDILRMWPAIQSAPAHGPHAIIRDVQPPDEKAVRQALPSDIPFDPRSRGPEIRKAIAAEVALGTDLPVLRRFAFCGVIRAQMKELGYDDCDPKTILRYLDTSSGADQRHLIRPKRR